MSLIHTIVNDAKKGVKGAEHLGHAVANDIVNGNLHIHMGHPQGHNLGKLTSGPFADNPGGLVGRVMKRGK